MEGGREEKKGHKIVIRRRSEEKRLVKVEGQSGRSEGDAVARRRRKAGKFGTDRSGGEDGARRMTVRDTRDG